MFVTVNPFHCCAIPLTTLQRFLSFCRSICDERKFVKQRGYISAVCRPVLDELLSWTVKKPCPIRLYCSMDYVQYVATSSCTYLIDIIDIERLNSGCRVGYSFRSKVVRISHSVYVILLACIFFFIYNSHTCWKLLFHLMLK